MRGRPGDRMDEFMTGATDIGGLTLPSRTALEALYQQKHGPRPGWSPTQRLKAGYFLPADVYEALLSALVSPGCRWLDVGGGSDVFPENQPLAQQLADRAQRLVAVDPSENVLANPYADERVRCLLEDYRTDQVFDLATLRMVAEHVTDPDRLVQTLSRLVAPRGLVVVLTVNQWAPLTVLSRSTPFRWHHQIKRLFWEGDEADTFPVAYRMNTRAVLAAQFAAHGFTERQFAYLDDLSALGGFRIGSRIELLAWKLCRQFHVRYPENCLLGVYERHV
jgi:2-polyprenyl-3-methyl-5-hydroxy-6-metoxy-1,4-benzoquinol methylase